MNSCGFNLKQKQKADHAKRKAQARARHWIKRALQLSTSDEDQTTAKCKKDDKQEADTLHATTEKMNTIEEGEANDSE